MTVSVNKHWAESTRKSRAKYGDSDGQRRQCAEQAKRFYKEREIDFSPDRFWSWPTSFSILISLIARSFVWFMRIHLVVNRLQFAINRRFYFSTNPKGNKLKHCNRPKVWTWPLIKWKFLVVIKNHKTRVKFKNNLDRSSHFGDTVIDFHDVSSFRALAREKFKISLI